MESVANVTIHQSQFPEKVQRDLLESLRTRDLRQKFHYDSVKQTQQWLALHEAYSPARRDPGCLEIYDSAARETAARTKENLVHLTGLGCGGGDKDVQILSALRSAGKTALYTPCDSSVQMVLTAQLRASRALKGMQCQPLVCDLPDCSTLPAILKSFDPVGSERIVTLFGVLHNFDPEAILPRVVNTVRAQDWFLCSANLSPGADYDEGVRRILPQYNNELTREWLLTVLLDLGIERHDGEIMIEVGRSPQGLGRIEGRFLFRRPRRIQVYGEDFAFLPGESFRLFISDRYTPARAAEVLQSFHLKMVEEWIAESGEEGVFLCKRS